jgi:hypothetical protein
MRATQSIGPSILQLARQNNVIQNLSYLSSL